MNEAVSLAWHGLALQRAIDADGRLPYELLRESRYALVAAERLEELPDGVTGRPLVAPRFDASAHLMPHLIDLQSLGSETRGNLLQKLDEQHARGEQACVSALLSTDASPETIEQHLRHAQTRTYGTQVGWQRIHDPYVLVQLPRVLGPAMTRRLFGPIRQWAVCLGAQWWVASLAQSSTTDDDAATAGHRPQRELWDGLLRISAVNRALHERAWMTLPQVVQHSEHLDQLAARAAARHQLTKAAEQAAYAALGALLRLDFDEHPDIAAAVAQHHHDRSADPSDDSTLIDTLRALPQDVWRQVHQSHALTL